MEMVNYGLTLEGKLGLFFNINSDNFSLKTNFTANYCLIYKHQFQLHHHDTRALWERENDKLTLLDNHFCWKAVHQNRFNTWNSSTIKDSFKSSAKGRIWKSIWTTYGTTSVTPHQEKYSWKQLGEKKKKKKMQSAFWLVASEWANI